MIPKGFKHSEETKRKMMENHKGMLGKRHTEEARRKIGVAFKGKKLSDEHREKLSKNNSRFWLGKKLSDETRKKLSEANKGKVAWNKGLPKEKNPLFGRKCSEETKRKIGESNKGRKPAPISEETRKKLSKTHKGKKLSEEHRRKMSEARKGDKGCNWKGGLVAKSEKIRHSIEFRLWREAVFARDNWICQKCKVKGGKLHPHHIQGFTQYHELRFAIDNGATLCIECHKSYHKRYGTKNINNQQLNEFIYGTT